MPPPPLTLPRLIIPAIGMLALLISTLASAVSAPDYTRLIQIAIATGSLAFVLFAFPLLFTRKPLLPTLFDLAGTLAAVTLVADALRRLS